MSTKVPSIVHPYPPVPGAPSGVGTFWPGHPFAPQSSLLTGLTHYWTLDEVSGSRVDSVGGITLTDVNTVASVSGMSGNAASFVAANTERLTAITPASPVSGQSYTWSFWFYPTTNNQTIIYRQATGGPGGLAFQFYIATNTRLDFYASVNPAQGTIAINQWQHVCAWVDTTVGTYGTAYISINGGAPTSAAVTAALVKDTTTNFYLGSEPTQRYFTGYLDEVGFWSRVLTANERTTNYNAGVGKFYPSF